MPSVIQDQLPGRARGLVPQTTGAEAAFYQDPQVTHVPMTVREALLLTASNSLQLTCCHHGGLLSQHTGIVNVSNTPFTFPFWALIHVSPSILKMLPQCSLRKSHRHLRHYSNATPPGSPSYHSLPLPEVRTLTAVGFITHGVLSTFCLVYLSKSGIM